jgi:hypothetical protein
MNPLLAPSETVPSAVPSISAGKLVTDRPIGLEGRAVCLVRDASLPENFAIPKSVHFWQ